MYMCCIFYIFLLLIQKIINVVKQRESRKTVDQHQTGLRGCDFCQRLYHKMATAAQTFACLSC